MAALKSIVSFLDDFLKIADIRDDSWNGLQFEGRGDIQRIAFAVDAGMDSFREALEEKVDLIIVHHGLFWKGSNPCMTGLNKDRMEFLSANGISLYCAHLPLDRHKDVGNNAQILKLLGASIKEALFEEEEGKKIGWRGELDEPATIKEIERRMRTELNASCRVLSFGKDKIKTIAVCSGGAGYSAFNEALESCVDLYITGDQIEIFLHAKDAKTNVIFAGHHATETIGLKALSKVVGKRLKVSTVFIDIPTGL